MVPNLPAAYTAAPVEIVRVPPKPGIRTTEFWVTVSTIVAAVTHALPSAWSWVPMALATAAYSISRGLAKR